MGLIKAITGSIGGVLADQWREFFYCESMDVDVLVTKGQKKTSRRSSNTKGEENIISNGSVVAVNEGQFMMIVDQGKVVEFSGEPGEYVYDSSTTPSMLYGGFGAGLVASFKEVGKRFTMGGEPGKDQRIYFFNMKELVGNKYGTPNAVPFRVIDKNIGLDIDISIRCHGEYSYKIVNPLLFYTNVSGNVTDVYRRDVIDGQLKTELMTALQPAFARISEMGIRYSALPGHTMELADALNQVLSEKWTALRGLAIASFGISSLKASDEDEAMIKQLQRSAVMRDPTMAAATLVGAQSEAMMSAAKNQGAGPVMAFAGLNMASQAGGMNAQSLYTMGASQPKAEKPDPDSWTCSCKAVNKGKFCSECAKPRPADTAGWTCSCGIINKGKFCMECGKPRPAGAKIYKCDKCGWELKEGMAAPKFCPECGDIFDDSDIVK